MLADDTLYTAYNADLWIRNASDRINLCILHRESNLQRFRLQFCYINPNRVGLLDCFTGLGGGGINLTIIYIGWHNTLNIIYYNIIHAVEIGWKLVENWSIYALLLSIYLPHIFDNYFKRYDTLLDSHITQIQDYKTTF